MSKDTINIKSNGIRNELKEIRKSIDNLTNAILMAQTHTHHDKTLTCLLVVILLMGCAGIQPKIRELNRQKFKETIKNMNVESPQEIYLVQVLYNEMVIKNKK